MEYMESMRLLSSHFWRDVFDPAMIVKTTLQTIIGTVLLGSFFMVCADYIFKPIDLSGRWNMTLKPEKAMSMNNKCVDITYSVLFTQNGSEIVGGGEKSRDSKSNNLACKEKEIFEREVDPGKGKKIHVTGYMKNNYIADDSISISYLEGNQDNLRFTMASLNVNGQNEIRGWYMSNISRAEGEIILSRVKR